MNLQRSVAIALALAMAVPALAVAVPAGAGDPHGGSQQAEAPKSSPISPKGSGSAAVGKLLAPGPGDPAVPLPNRDLSDSPSGSAASSGPRIYGREETGGGVLGLRFPIPVTPQPEAQQH